MNSKESIVELLGFKDGIINLGVDTSKDSNLSALKNHYIKQISRFGDGEDGIDDVYFSGDIPSVYFKSVPDFSLSTVEKVVRLQRKVWNQGKVPFLFFESPLEIRVYNCYETPKQLATDINEEKLRLILASKAADDLGDLLNVFSKVAIESGTIWNTEKYSEKIRHKTRVDQALIYNLRKTRQRLLSQGLPKDIIHDLLLRSLFILYLQDRGATDAIFYQQYIAEADSYFSILLNKEATYKVFEKLEEAFNGNLCPVQPLEYVLVNEGHLEEVRKCFWSDLPDQPRLFDWRIFDFEVIPIQLISEIYEDFLSSEVGEIQMAERGAYYTPHALAEFVLNEVLPYPSETNKEHNIRVLDPTCGSGIFLVDSLNRLLDRWEYTHAPEKLTFETIKGIVKSNIFGIEIEAEAIKVAAFSIYLAMLDRLNPKTLWQNNHFPYLIYDGRIKDKAKQGNNIFLMSSLGPGPFNELTFDLIVGNPPFTTKVTKEVRFYLDNYGFAKETVLAFLHRATALCPNGKIALISTSKILFNTGVKYQRFREFMFAHSYVQKLYNFSSLRRASKKTGGRNLFASATSPVCVLIYSKYAPDIPSSRLPYYAPTTAIKNRLVDGIVIDPIDVQHLPRIECRKTDTKIWKIAMWGTERDFRLIERFKIYETIEQVAHKKGWEKSMGVGFELSQPVYENEEIKLIPHINASRLTRYVTPRRDTTVINDEVFYRLGNSEAFKAPHLLIKEGQEKKRYCASFLSFDCSFKKTVFGIHSTDSDALKLLAAYLNSDLAFYLMFLTSSTWGIERERVQTNEVLNLPALCFAVPKNTVNEIVGYFDEISKIKNGEFLSIESRIQPLEKSIEDALWNGLDLSVNDRILVEDFLKYRLDAFQSKHTSVAFAACLVENMKVYAEFLCTTINNSLTEASTLYTHAAYFELSVKEPLQVVVLYLAEGEHAGTSVKKLTSSRVSSILSLLEQHSYSEYSESLYYRKFIRYYLDDAIYIVKPNEQRFWSRTMGLNDADEIILEFMTSDV